MNIDAQIVEMLNRIRSNDWPDERKLRVLTNIRAHLDEVIEEVEYDITIGIDDLNDVWGTHPDTGW